MVPCSNPYTLIFLFKFYTILEGQTPLSHCREDFFPFCWVNMPFKTSFSLIYSLMIQYSLPLSPNLPFLPHWPLWSAIEPRNTLISFLFFLFSLLLSFNHTTTLFFHFLLSFLPFHHLWSPLFPHFSSIPPPYKATTPPPLLHRYLRRHIVAPPSHYRRWPPLNFFNFLLFSFFRNSPL